MTLATPLSCSQVARPSSKGLVSTGQAPRQEHHHVGAGCFHCAEMLFQPSSIGNEASGIHDTSFQISMKCDPQGIVHQCRVVRRHDHVHCVFFGAHVEGDGVGSIHDQIKATSPIRFGLEDLTCHPSAHSSYFVFLWIVLFCLCILFFVFCFCFFKELRKGFNVA